MLEARPGKHLVGAIVAAVFIALLTPATAIVSLRSSTRRVDQLARDAVDDLALVHQLQIDVQQLSIANRRALSSGEQAPLTVARPRFEATRDRWRRRADQVPELAMLERALADHVTMVMMATDPNMVDVTSRTSGDTFDKASASAILNLRNRFDAAMQRTHSLAHRAQWTIIFTSVIGGVLGIGIAVAMLRALARHTKRSRSAAEVAKHAIGDRLDLFGATAELLEPVTAIMAAAASLRSRKVRELVEARHLDKIASASSLAQHQLEQLIDLSQIEGGTIELRFEPCEVSELLRAAVSSYAEINPIRVVELRATPTGIPSLNVDRARILRALLILIDNVARGAWHGAVLSVEISQRDKAIRFSALDDSPRQLPEVGTKSTADARRSTTLGLRIAKRIVEVHGGRTGVERTANKGTSFWFELPRGPELLR